VNPADFDKVRQDDQVSIPDFTKAIGCTIKTKA